MNEDELNINDLGENDGGMAATAEPETPRPGHVPEKFWDPESGAVRVDDLVKSYRELERRMGRTGSVPDTPEGYEITLGDGIVEADADVFARFHAAGLTREQAQAVYELAHEKLGPVISGLSGSHEADSQAERLKEHFGGPEQWDAARRRLSAWGGENLSDDVYQALSSSYEGVLAMQAMMNSKEPGFARGGAVGAGPDETALRAMMSDPRYWRQRDPAYVERVRQGFRDLYPGDT